MKRSILLVFAHPDDESFGVGGITIKYTRAGVPVDLICATRGEKGTRLEVPDDMDTGTARESELKAAAGILGIRNVYFLGYMDGGLEQVNFDEIVNSLLVIMQQIQPGVIITFGPDGITGHPDHITIGKAATRAFEILVTQRTGQAKLYYVTIPESIVAGHEGLGIVTMPDKMVTTSIDISVIADLKMKAISAHRSQQDARDFIEMLQNYQSAHFADKEFLYRASPKTTTKETDLFQP